MRYSGLDGLRGLAALAVVGSHMFLTLPFAVGAADHSFGAAAWIEVLKRTPLQALTAGHEAVIVFFILSGFVLCLPFIPVRKTPWLAYYPKRLVRLYLPVLASVALSLAWFVLVPRLENPQETSWLNGHHRTLGLFQVFLDSGLLLGAGKYNSVLWSLTWEVYFSLALPLYVLAARLLGRFWPAGALLMVALSSVGAGLDNDALTYLPVFGVGVFLAAGRDQILGWAERLWFPRGCALAAALLFTLYWAGVPGLTGQKVLVTACAALVLTFLLFRPARRLTDTRIVSWLGRRSFSLYLVHEPVLVSAALLTPAPFRIPGILAGAMLVFVLTAVFYRWVEAPSQRAAGAVGRWVSGRIRPGAASQTRERHAGLSGAHD